MGYFYFDETIQERGGFIIGAFVYSPIDLTPEIMAAVEKVGLSPGVDEFKSGARMDRNPAQSKLRDLLSAVLSETNVGVVVLPSNDRAALGNEALLALSKFVNANALSQDSHKVYFDEGIKVDPHVMHLFASTGGAICELNFSQNSKIVSGIQLADLAAHSLGGMLLEELGIISKTVRPGDRMGYHPDDEVELGFELWASLRYQFFRAPQPNPGPIPEDPVGEQIFDVASYGLHVSKDCSSTLRHAALKRFGQSYLGCIH